MANDAPAADSTAADFESLLLHERADLQGQLAELGFGDSGFLKYDSNFADSSQVTAERGEADTLARGLKETLEEVEAALARLAEGTYGLCEGCGQPISPARLEAMPTAKRCMACASKA